MAAECRRGECFDVLVEVQRRRQGDGGGAIGDVDRYGRDHAAAEDHVDLITGRRDRSVRLYPEFVGGLAADRAGVEELAVPADRDRFKFAALVDREDRVPRPGRNIRVVKVRPAARGDGSNEQHEYGSGRSVSADEHAAPFSGLARAALCASSG